MKNLHCVFKFSFLQNLLKNKKFIFFVLILFLMQQYSCSTTEPPSNQTIALKLEDVSCTEAWIQFATTNIQIPNNITLYINNQLKKTINLTTTDTLLYIDSLLPNQNYTFQASSIQNQVSSISSNKVTATTLDTTSHNFTWQTFTFGQHSSSTLYDVAIINENDIWAVGEIYMNDSLGNPDPNCYNAVHWNGQSWELKRIGGYGGWACHTVFAFSTNDIWFEGNIHWDGANYTVHKNGWPLMPNGDGWQVNKMWGSSSNDLYAVGNSGNIAHYTQSEGTNNGSWTKIESGTDVNLKDIYGTPDGKTIWISGYEDFKPTVLLKISNSIIETVFSSSDYLFIFDPEHLSGGIEGVWTNSNDFVYITTWYSLYRKSVYLDPSKEEAMIAGSPLIAFGSKSRGTDINDIYTIGFRNTIHHYNGVTFRTYKELTEGNVTYYSLCVKSSLTVLCGQKYENGISDKAIITLIK